MQLIWNYFSGQHHHWCIQQKNKYNKIQTENKRCYVIQRALIKNCSFKNSKPMPIKHGHIYILQRSVFNSPGHEHIFQWKNFLLNAFTHHQYFNNAYFKEVSYVQIYVQACSGRASLDGGRIGSQLLLRALQHFSMVMHKPLQVWRADSRGKGACA